MSQIYRGITDLLLFRNESRDTLLFQIMSFIQFNGFSMYSMT